MSLFPATSTRLGCLIVWALFAVGIVAELNNETSPTHSFKSRPDLHAPILTIDLIKPELVTPGYIFLAPYRNLDPAPYIYDNYGNLVWSGAGSGGPKTAHAPRVCTYKGTDHLCFFQGEQQKGFARGHGVIMDQSYRVVKTVESTGAGASSDMHEFKLTPFSNGTTALMTVYQPRRYDLTANPRFNIRNGLGWIVEGVFQEVDIETGALIFEWRSLDHVDPSAAWTLPGTTDTSGDGLTQQTPWDYFHLNSIDKNADGDYLLSARHVSAVYKVSGEDGHIIWQLGGNSPSFEQTNFAFSYQHHARWISENATHTLLSLFDNASNNYNWTGPESSGIILSINHIDLTATKIQSYAPPSPNLISSSQGSFQILPDNGGALIVWGEHAHFTEHTSTGEIVLSGKLADRLSDVMIYRSYKFPWVGRPLTSPALYAFSRDGEEENARTTFWASWNGATEVVRWELWTADERGGPWGNYGSADREGRFETEFFIERFERWGFVVARDGGGMELGRSAVVKTFVPSAGLRQYCDERDCAAARGLEEGEEVVPYEAEDSTREGERTTDRGYDTAHYYDVAGFEVEEVEGRRRRRREEKWVVALGVVIGIGVVWGALAVWRVGGWRRVLARKGGVVDWSVWWRWNRYARLKQEDWWEGKGVL
ncbi:unnamed protein product [Zymoseptoria tritici ST99CH_1A5]|uniref:Arylsulfotransferase N-terminal domain-containing protein n=1 Tax=Zymoseptoria tritici ST99CH_1A5 TaxID=1276529 RepID=A0A1Y6L4R7_ZYMTR|nr:unnamed protein product [Zymoseptoria tritici ST99CH_1A5]